MAALPFSIDDAVADELGAMPQSVKTIGMYSAISDMRKLTSQPKLGVRGASSRSRADFFKRRLATAWQCAHGAG